MSSQSQIIANRLNAQRSTGPRTPEGKALASKNSLKHGLSARRDVITTESQEKFDLHRDALLNELNPQTPMESMLADRIVSLSWRLKRADLIQNQTIDALTEKDAANPLAKIAKSLGLKSLGLLQPDPADSNPDLILGRIALKDFSNERVLDRLLMYERRTEHSLFKTTLELQRLRLLRNLESQHSQQNSTPAFIGCSSQKSPDNPVPPSTPLNNKSSIVNIENPPAPPSNRRRHDDAETIDHPQSPTEPPKPQTSTPRTQDDIRHPTYEIRKNEPNSQNPETAATNCATKSYNNIPLHPPQENEPNRTQFIAAKPPAKPEQTQFPRHDIRHPTSDIRTNDPHAARHKDRTTPPPEPPVAPASHPDNDPDYLFGRNHLRRRNV